MNVSFDTKTCAGFILIALLVFASVISTPAVFAEKSDDKKDKKEKDKDKKEKKDKKVKDKDDDDDYSTTTTTTTTTTVITTTTTTTINNTNEANVTVETDDGSVQVVLATSSGWFSSSDNVDVESIPSTVGVPPADLPYGLLSFTISGVPVGSTATVTLTFPSAVPADSQYWKIVGNAWIVLPAELVGSNDGDNVLTLTLTDGGIGDQDGLANGEIVDPGGPGTQTSNTSGGCRTVTITNDPSVYARCVVIDTVPPKIMKTFMTPTGNLCVKTADNTETVKVTYNGMEVQRWSGSNDHFCADEKLPAIVKIVAEDIAGNESEMVAINPQNVVQADAEQTFSAVVSKELNPHHGIEGITLDTTEPLKQIRIVKSPEFTDKELHISDKALTEIDGKLTIELTYKGQYGKERHGYVYVFAANKGLLATFDVVVNEDVRLYQHEQKKSHAAYDLEMRSVSSLDVMNLNAFQKAELENVFAGEYTMTQDRILGMVITLLDGTRT